MSHGNSIGRPAIATCITLVAIAAAFSCAAADISVMVVDRDGRGVAEVVVAATPVAPMTAAATPAANSAGVNSAAAPGLKPAVMDQRNREFVPRVLAVGIGTSVEFPNNDSVSHQVYSFSAAKRFQLPLYKGQPHPPVIFDKSGLVVLGCNIHDAMVGYVFVTEAPYFGITATAGGVAFNDLPAGDYRIVVWGPYISDAPASLVRTIHVNDNEPATARIQLSLALRARPEPRPHRRDWEY